MYPLDKMRLVPISEEYETPIIEEENEKLRIHGRPIPSEEEIKHREKEIPPEIKCATTNEIVEKMIKFIKKYIDLFEINTETKLLLMWNRLIDMFWVSEGCGWISAETKWLPPNSSLDDNTRLKLMEAEEIAKDLLSRELSNREKEQYKKEREELLPSLIKECIEWAIDRGFKKVTKQDVEAFLFEKGIDVSKQTERGLYLMVNVELKSKNKRV